MRWNFAFFATHPAFLYCIFSLANSHSHLSESTVSFRLQYPNGNRRNQTLNHTNLEQISMCVCVFVLDDSKRKLIGIT